MATGKALGTLTTRGYLTSIVEKTDAAMAHFFASDSAQSYIFLNIGNLPVLMANAGNDMYAFQESLQRTLEAYLGRINDSALVTIENDMETNKTSRINFVIRAQVTHAGEAYDVSHLLSMIDGKFEKIQKLNNTGSVS